MSSSQPTVDAGTVNESHRRQDGRTLAQERSEELARAAVHLGITSIWNLPYRDSGMRGSPDNAHPRALVQQPVQRLAVELVDYIRRLAPQVVITHDPYGGYGHPDHVRCCEAATVAFYAAGQEIAAPALPGGAGMPPHRPQKLYYTCFDKRMLRWIVKFMQLTGRNPRKVGRNEDVDLVQIASWETPIHARIDVDAFLGQKERASRAPCPVSTAAAPPHCARCPNRCADVSPVTKATRAPFPRPAPTRSRTCFTTSSCTVDAGRLLQHVASLRVTAQTRTTPFAPASAIAGNLGHFRL